MKRLAALFAFLVSASLAAAPTSKSVLMLYTQDASGGMQMHCTTTAFKQEGDKTLFLTAAHCVTKPSQKPGEVEVIRDPMFLSSDEMDSKMFIRANLEKLGRQLEGYDFAILSTPKQSIPVIEIGDAAELGADVINISAPIGLGKVYFRGIVSLPVIDRPLIDEEQHINWAGAMLVQIPSEGGSSGSAIVDAKSGKIVGILVGHYRSLTLAVPVSRISTTDKKYLMPTTPGSSAPEMSPAGAKAAPPNGD